MNTTANQFLSGGEQLYPGLEARIDAALQNRLQDSDQYSTDEIRAVSGLDRSLFPTDFELDKDLFERLQLLAGFSNCGLPKTYAIQSHRPFLGPAIVFVKKVAWRFTRAQLEDAFAGVQEFCSWMVHSYAKQTYEIEQLKRRLKDLEGPKH